MFGIGETEFAIIIIFAFLLFGPDKLPGMGRTLGRALRQFRDAQDGITKVVQAEVVDPLNEAMNEPSKKKQAERQAALDEDADIDLLEDEGEDRPRRGTTESFAERKKRLEAERKAKLEAQKAETAGATAVADVDVDADADADLDADADVDVDTAAAAETPEPNSAPEPEPEPDQTSVAALYGMAPRKSSRRVAAEEAAAEAEAEAAAEAAADTEEAADTDTDATTDADTTTDNGEEDGTTEA